MLLTSATLQRNKLQHSAVVLYGIQAQPPMTEWSRKVCPSATTQNSWPHVDGEIDPFLLHHYSPSNQQTCMSELQCVIVGAFQWVHSTWRNPRQTSTDQFGLLLLFSLPVFHMYRPARSLSQKLMQNAAFHWAKACPWNKKRYWRLWLGHWNDNFIQQQSFNAGIFFQWCVWNKSSITHSWFHNLR